MTPSDRRVALLPRPLECEKLPGQFQLSASIEFSVDVEDPRVRRAAERLRARLPKTSNSVSGACHVSVDRAIGRPHGYRLCVEPARLELVGGSPAGCFYGLQTLSQMIEGGGEVTCCLIEDYPSFDTRGLLHDVTRGKVPKLSTLKLLADRLARLKINQLQLYIEHAFAFSFDREICGTDDGLTPAEVRELDAYCRERFIDLVPAVATLGHMGRVLSIPRYRSLAEIELTTSWEQMTWLQRLKGATLDVLNPDSRVLVERIWTDILAAFSSPVVNICGDEPWDLGKGKNATLTQPAAAEAYVEHLRYTAELCAKHGRSCQIWGDVIRNHTILLGRLPPEVTVLHWGYDDRSDYSGTAAFASAGYKTLVCPGTTGWKRVLNAMDLAERNITTFATAGKTHGAAGVLNTDWGDLGHFNLLAGSWHAIALGAALAWNPDHPTGAEFDLLFANSVLGVSADLVGHLRTASAIAESCETWRALITLPQELESGKLPRLGALDAAAHAAAHAVHILKRMEASDEHLRHDHRELAIACRFTELVVEHLRRAIGQLRPATDWRDRVGAAVVDYSDCWRVRNKVAGLRDIAEALRA